MQSSRICITSQKLPVCIIYVWHFQKVTMFCIVCIYFSGYMYLYNQSGNQLNLRHKDKRDFVFTYHAGNKLFI